MKRKKSVRQRSTLPSSEEARPMEGIGIRTKGGKEIHAGSLSAAETQIATAVATGITIVAIVEGIWMLGATERGVETGIGTRTTTGFRVRAVGKTRTIKAGTQDVSARTDGIPRKKREEMTISRASGPGHQMEKMEEGRTVEIRPTVEINRR